MPGNALAKRAVTKFAIKATPSILAHVVGNALGAGELSNVSRSICETIKTVTCKDRIVMEQAIKAQALLDEKVYDRFLTLLNDAVQVYVQSDCKDYSMALEAIFHDASAPLEEKVKYALMLKEQQHKYRMEMLKMVVGGVVIYRFINATADSMDKVTSQIPKIVELVDKVDKRHEETKRKQAQEITKRKKQEERTKRKQAGEETKRLRKGGKPK